MEHVCHHPAMTEEQQRRKKWLQAESSAFKALTSVVMDNNLLRDLKQMARFKHTGMHFLKTHDLHSIICFL